MAKLIVWISLISWFGLTGKNAAHPIDRSTDIQLSQDTVYSGRDKNITITVTFSDIHALKFLIIRKGSTVMKDYAVIAAKKIKGDFIFKYTVNSDDDFTFSARSLDGTVQTRHLHIDNREGLLPTGLQMVSRLTGKTLKSGQTFTDLNPNQTATKYDVGCTDLGIMWAMGSSKVGIFFGDTQGRDFAPAGGGGGNGSNWRSNVLAFSQDTDLTKGLVFSHMVTKTDDSTVARQIVHSDHQTDGTGSFTAIPTAAIRAAGVDYVHYMDVRSWGAPGNWTTNFSALYKSTDGGLNWEACPEIRFAAHSHFAQVCYGKKNGFVYMIGTAAGRYGAGYLCRFKENNILDQSSYQYWHNGKWTQNDENSATPLFEAPVGELSLTYNSRFKRWIVTYLDVKEHAIIMRSAKEITGSWSSKKVLISSLDKHNLYAGLYGGFIYPLKEHSEDLYVTMSLWHPYNVFLMKATLKLIE